MTMTTDVTEDQVVLTREGRHLLKARLGHLEGRVIPELRLLGVAVVAEDRPGGTTRSSWATR